MIDSGGIYQIRNLINGKFYIGSAINFRRRWNSHISLLRRNLHKNRHLQHSWNKHGQDNFVFEIIEQVDEIENLLIYEQSYLDKYRPFDQNIIFNIFEYTSNIFESKMPEETKLLLSQSWTKKKKEKISNLSKQRWLDPIVRKKMIEGIKAFWTHERKMEKSFSQIGEKNFMWGVKKSQESKDKISATLKGRFAGEKNSQAILTWEKVKDIRKKYKEENYSFSDLSKEYGIVFQHVEDIVHNICWVDENYQYDPKSRKKANSKLS